MKKLHYCLNDSLQLDDGVGLKKIKGAKTICLHPEHNPPSHIALEAGATYKHTCPKCKQTITFAVPLIIN